MAAMINRALRHCSCMLVASKSGIWGLEEFGDVVEMHAEMHNTRTILVIVDAIARDLPGVGPDVCRQIWVRVVNARVDHAHNDVAGALRVSPGRLCQAGCHARCVQAELGHTPLVRQEGVVWWFAGIEVKSVQLMIGLGKLNTCTRQKGQLRMTMYWLG